MIRTRIVLLILLALSPAALGQFVTITGNVLDPSGNPYSGGSGRALLVSGNGSGNQSWMLSGTNPVNPVVVINNMDASGAFSVRLTNTSLITPTAAQPEWQFQFCNNDASICFTMTPMALTSSQSISATIQAQSASLGSLSVGNAQKLEGKTWESPGGIGFTTPNTGAFTTGLFSGVITSTVGTGTSPFNISSTTVVPNLHATNSDQLLGSTWLAPPAIGGGTPNTGNFTTGSFSGQITSTLLTGTPPFNISSTTLVPNLHVANSDQLLGGTWAIPGTIGSSTPNTGAFTTLSATGQITSTLATGTPPFVISSTTLVPNLHVGNSDQLLGGTWAAPGAIGSTTPNTGAFTTLNSTGGAMNGSIGATTPSSGVFTTMNGILNAATYSGADIGAKILTTIAALPSTGGTIFVPASSSGSFASGIVINKPVHLIFDCGGVYTYSGAGNAITIANSASTENVVIEGCAGGYGVTATTGTVIAVTNTGANGLVAGTGSPSPLAFLGSTIKNIQFKGPGSGTGVGIKLIDSLNILIEQVKIQSFGSHGLYCLGDALVVGCNTSTFHIVRSSTNGGDGFHLTGSVQGANLNRFIGTFADNNVNGYVLDQANQNEFLNAYSRDESANVAWKLIASAANYGTIYSENETTALSMDANSTINNLNVLSGDNVVSTTPTGAQNSYTVRGYHTSYVNCRVFGAISFNVTPVTVCDWPLMPTSPATTPHLAFNFHCDLTWQVTAGTTPTMTLGLNSAGVPVDIVATAIVYTDNNLTGTTATIATTSSGATNIITTPVLTPSATNFPAVIFGTIVPPTTGGTNDFKITAVGTGVGVAGGINTGSGCYLY